MSDRLSWSTNNSLLPAFRMIAIHQLDGNSNVEYFCLSHSLRVTEKQFTITCFCFTFVDFHVILSCPSVRSIGCFLKVGAWVSDLV